MSADLETPDRETLDREAERIVHDIKIPPCPAILTQLVREMRQDEVDFPRIGRLIGKDVGLAAAMLKTVNSAFYGLRTKATSVPQALVLLGLRNVAQLVTGLLLRQAFPVSTNAMMEDFWVSSSSIALIAAHVSGKVKGVNRDEAHTFALFRDCGVPLMANKFNDFETTQSAAKHDQAKSVTDIEREHYSTDHARIGYHLARSWLLPEETCQAILHHHDYSSWRERSDDVPAASAKLIALALVAEWLFTSTTIGGKCHGWDVAGETALALLGIEQAELAASAQEVKNLLAGK